MPVTTIEVCRRYTEEQEVALIDAVHRALVEALKIPEADRTLRLVVHERHRFAIDPGKDDRLTLITIDLFEGRSLNAKAALYQALVRNLAPFAIPANHIKTLLREIPRENWGIRGLPATEIDLGFKIEV